MPRDEVCLRESDVAADHVECRVAEDLLEAEHVAPVDEVAAGERVAERVGAAAGANPRPPPETGDCDLDATAAKHPAPATDEQRVNGADERPVGDVAEEGPAGGGPERDDPLGGSLAHDPDRPVRPQIANPERGDLGES